MPRNYSNNPQPLQSSKPYHDLQTIFVDFILNIGTLSCYRPFSFTFLDGCGKTEAGKIQALMIDLDLVSKSVCCGFYLKKNVAYYTHLFCCTEMR